ncbi:thioredoxin-like protein [Bombardia bombarda]|uniref:Thioredoxin-like protein n=1 Tax=Bombardia bombarda TaxID=252184 RepID=A0AA39WAR9_9PEZI|nr:thioredoxin-like protein [Bombardia bombarda]
MGSQDKLILYTSHLCPWAHRAHIVLDELNIPHEQVLIDLTVPRTPEYLKINPRGLVPALSVNGEILLESAIVANYLLDANPSHILPASNEPGAALKRARIAFFVDNFIGKFLGQQVKIASAKAEDQGALIDAAVATILKEVEPLLADAKPFFGGSETITQAEVLTGSFAIRLKALTARGVYPKVLWETLVEKAPNLVKWVDAVSAHPSVKSVFPEDDIVRITVNRLEKARAAAASA